MSIARVALVFLLLVYPFSVTVAPEWRVEVTDENGKPLAGAYVSEFATHGTLNFKLNDALCTDLNGEARFGRHSVRASILTRISRWRFNIYGGSGPYVAIGVDRLGYGEIPTQNPEPNFKGMTWYGSPRRVNSKVALQKCPDRFTGYKCSFKYDEFFANNSTARQIAACQSSR